ncbi:hypothetical protein QBC38DRAFT_65630 [Podospora fimiseda]|uniref:BZIP domain-containing protein n=1 Tax=Podospora fimiseda TaxID=252190 RepID=A0AAN7BGC9_9PEZI|nr:hypothetical protein QBC38DRAFT_65630 [Podospora fimiseda]
MSRSMSTSPAGTQPGLIDSLDSFVDFTTYENLPLHSPSLSPNTANKGVFTRPNIKTEATTANSLLSTGQQLTGPSHQYELYKQQTGIVPGALATTFAVNQNTHLHGFAPYSTFGYFGGMGNTDDLFDFNSVPGMTSPELDNMEFDSPSADPNSLFFDTVDPNSIGGQEPGMSSPTPLTSNVGRLWPGMHQQAALAKQQQQQQRAAQAQAHAQQSKQAPKQKSPQASDPLVEQKITQLLNSMRAKTSSESPQSQPLINPPRMKKDEDDMDEDERLLASEEGKKLSSKERRQLRNKVSARAFRSRRKEYITQLEAEIANKVTENGDLRAENRALIDENKRLTDLTRMLLSSPPFSDFLNQLSANPSMVPASQPQSQQTQQQEQQRQVPKDVNPYAASQQVQQQQIGLAVIPESNVDFSMLNMDAADGFNYQPRVYAVLETPEPILDASVLSGKSLDYSEEQCTSEEKVEMPIIEQPPAFLEEKKLEPAPVNEEFENDPAFALYHDSPSAPTDSSTCPVELDLEALSPVDIFGGIEPEKVYARYELVDSTEEEAAANLASLRIDRINANLEAVASRLELLTCDL